MKTLKEVLLEAVPPKQYVGQTAGAPGKTDDWSISAADLAKKAHDPQFVGQLKQKGNIDVSNLMRQISSAINYNTLEGMSEQDINLLKQRIDQHIEAVKHTLKQRASSPSNVSSAAPREPTAKTKIGG